jgi:hypothetical protein
MDIIDYLSFSEVTIQLDDLKEMIRTAQAEAWQEGQDAGWSGVRSDQNPYFV